MVLFFGSHSHPLGQGDRHGPCLLAIDGLACLGGVDEHLVVPVIRCGNNDRFDLRLGQQVLEIQVRPDIRIAGCRSRPSFARGARLTHIANSHHLRRIACWGVLDQVPTPRAGPDMSDAAADWLSGSCTSQYGRCGERTLLWAHSRCLKKCSTASFFCLKFTTTSLFGPLTWFRCIYDFAFGVQSPGPLGWYPDTKLSFIAGQGRVECPPSGARLQEAEVRGPGRGQAGDGTGAFRLLTPEPVNPPSAPPRPLPP